MAKLDKSLPVLNNPKLKKYGDSRPDLRVNLPNLMLENQEPIVKMMIYKMPWFVCFVFVTVLFYMRREEGEQKGRRMNCSDITI